MPNGHVIEADGKKLEYMGFRQSSTDYQNANPPPSILEIQEQWNFTETEVVSAGSTSMIDVFIELLTSIPEVVKIVTLKKKRNVLSLWTVLSKDKVETYKRVFKMQRQFRRQFRNVEFDFFVLTDKQIGIIPPDFSLVFTKE
ncbi:hypothetical protein KAS42_02030 [bacterium]|nr:hypothetical protein [bacterium]